MGACTVTGTVFKYGVWRVKHRGVAVGLYYGITIIIVSLATAMTVLTLNIHHKGDHGAPVPRLIQKICFDRLLARVLCLRAYKVDEQQDGTAAVCAYMIFLLRVFSLLLPVPLPFFRSSSSSSSSSSAAAAAAAAAAATATAASS